MGKCIELASWQNLNTSLSYSNFGTASCGISVTVCLFDKRICVAAETAQRVIRTVSLLYIGPYYSICIALGLNTRTGRLSVAVACRPLLACVLLRRMRGHPDDAGFLSLNKHYSAC